MKLSNRLVGSAAILCLVPFAMAQGSDVGAAMKEGLGTYLWVCFLGGLASLLTPCVFPMIPVTVSYFSKRKEGAALAGALAYSLGIIATFAIIGILATAIFGATGIQNFAAGPWFNIALAAIFVLLALNLFGLYELQVPPAISNRTLKASKTGGLAGPFFMGATFSLTSFTCTMPIVAALLTASTKGSIVMPTIGMATYGLAFALPFFALALFPSSMAKMPKAGGWLNSVKPVLAYIELAAAVKFLSNADLAWSLGILTRPVMLGIWIGICALLTGYLLGFPRSLGSTGWGRRGLALVALVGCFFLASGLKGHKLGDFEAYLPLDPYPSLLKAKPQNLAQSGPIVAVDFADALAKSKSTGRPIFVDFTGVNCTNCRWMEDNIFPKAVVKSELDKTIHVTLYTDRPNPSDQANQKLQTTLAKNNALPTYLLLTPDQKVIAKYEGAEPEAAKFAAFLKQATSAPSTKPSQS